jgi:hypothetical protein
MKKLFFLFFVILLSICDKSYGLDFSYHEPPQLPNYSAWTTKDTILESTFVLTAIADMSQTMQFRQRGDTERWSCLFGKSPSRTRVLEVFAPYMIAHAYVAYKLNSPYREYWQIGFILFEANNVRFNTVFGVGIHCPF